jgi:hypothetical protein
MVGYRQHKSYIAYLNGGTRPDQRLMPPLATNRDGRPFINPGGVFCRFRGEMDQMCSQVTVQRFPKLLSSRY